MADAPQPEIDLVGNLDGSSPDGDLTGWLWAPGEPQRRRRILVFADGREVAQAVADLPRADLAAAGIGDGSHGFRIRPASHGLPPGAAVLLTLRDAETGRQIGNPTTVAAPVAEPAPPRVLTGNLDQVTNDGWITGWCWYPADPQARVALVVAVDGETVGVATANLPRPDLARVGIGDGAYGFTFAVPWSLMASRGTMTVAVRDAATGEAVGAPVTLRMGLRSGAEARVADLERQLRMLRAEVALHAEQARGRDEDRAARDLFRTVAAFFRELADTPAEAGFAAAGLRGALADFANRHPPLVLAVPERPDATILLAADGTAGDVHRALAGLVATGADRRADVVLLDAGEGGAALALMPSAVANLRYRRADPSLVAADNAVAAASRAPVVVFLSAAIVAQEGWLDALLGTLREEVDADVVTARILAADGTVETSGLRVGADIDPAPIDADAWPGPEAGRVLRAVDAVTADAVAVRRGAFGAHGGLAAAFDDRGAALVDLCLAVRAGGRRVVCQPQAELLRPADAPPPAALDAEQRARLRRRWRARAVPASATEPVGHALFVDGTIPRADRDAGSVILVEQMLTLRDLGWRVTFAPTEAAVADPAATAALERRGIAVAGPRTEQSITDVLRESGAGLGLVAVCRHIHAAMLFERIAALAPAARRVFLPVDLHFLREEREAGVTGRAVPAAEDTRAQELACVAAADATVVHSEHERRLLAEAAPSGAVHLLRWVVRVDDAAVTPFTQRHGLCFVGSFLHPPNVDAVTWFAAEVMPLLRRQRPGLVLHVVGGDPPASVAALAGPDVIVHGWVADLATILASVRLTVAPLRFGAGFKGKVATSLAAGVPVVATPIAVEGTGLEAGQGTQVAVRARDFAAAIHRLHDDPVAWAEQSERGRASCRALYAPAVARVVWGDLLDRLGLPARGR